MAQDVTDDTGNTPTATNTPRKVRGLLDVVDAEANGEAWVLDDSDPLAGIGLGLGATPEAQRLVMLGLLSEREAELDRRLAELKRGKGRPREPISIDEKRAEAVLGAAKFAKERCGQTGITQIEAINIAGQIDKILCSVGVRDKRLFSNYSSSATIQNSVSKGLRLLQVDLKEFMKK
jgi:hypothetical protein